MLIQFTTSVAGRNFAYRYKQKVDLRPDIANRFIAARQAVAVDQDVEEATRSAPEQAVSRRGRRRGNALTRLLG